MNASDFVGKGITFPIKINAKGGIDLETGVPLINSSIKIILGWDRSKILHSQFKSELPSLIGEPNDLILAHLAQYYILDSLHTWEKRIKILEIDTDKVDQEKLEVSFKYRISNTSTESEFAYPLNNETQS